MDPMLIIPQERKTPHPLLLILVIGLTALLYLQLAF